MRHLGIKALHREEKMSGHRKSGLIALAAAQLSCSLTMACPGSLRRCRFGLGRALPVDVLRQREDRHQRGGPPARIRPMGQVLVHLELLDGRLRRHGQ